MLNWASRFNISAFLDSQNYQLPFHSCDGLLAAGVVESVQAAAGHALEDLRHFASRHQDWLFGHFSYDLVKETEPFGDSRQGANPIGFPDLFFFVPAVVLELKGRCLRIGSLREDHGEIFEAILAMPGEAAEETGAGEAPLLQAAFSREEYLDTIRTLQQHILRGDAYEINFCQEFYSHPARIDPLATWSSLSRASPNPFSAYYRLNNTYLLCASPERYLRREGNTLISQPIKGTAPRVQDDPRADEAAGAGLRASAKDRSENVMVVDLVRNDLSKICIPGSVRVRELFGIYGFPQVYQMTSTIQGELSPENGFIEAIKATFPMGSMTGAPKKRVVQLIDRYERNSRGLFSGALGYVTPEGDFDFNVIIRSLFYDQAKQYLSYQVGSGITFYSDPEQEYEECLVKAEGIKKALGVRTQG
jgi:para-aminobenzoate synthetase component 1